MNRPYSTVAALLLTLPLAAALPSPCVAGPSAAEIAGTWEGVLEAGGQSLRLRLHLRATDSGELEAQIDSPDQGAQGIPVESVAYDGDSIRLDVKVIAAVYEARVAADGEALDGEWRQGGQAFPLRLERATEE